MISNKKHAWHVQENNATPLIIEGALEFSYENKQCICNPGDIIYLPAMVKHQSIALHQGGIYAIATELVYFN